MSFHADELGHIYSLHLICFGKISFTALTVSKVVLTAFFFSFLFFSCGLSFNMGNTPQDLLLLLQPHSGMWISAPLSPQRGRRCRGAREEYLL